MRYFYKVNEIKALIGDNWWAVLYQLAPELNEAIEFAGRHTTCPVHGSSKPKGDGFRLFRDSYRTGAGVCNTCGIYSNGFNLLMWLKGWSFYECLLALGDLLNANRYISKTHTLKTQRQRTQVKNNKTPPMWLKAVKEKSLKRRNAQQTYKKQLLKKYLQLWDSCLPITSCQAYPALSYLAGRHLHLDSNQLAVIDSLRFHPQLPFYDEQRRLAGYFPALMAMVRDVNGGFITLHRIYLHNPLSQEDQFSAKAKKMMMLPAERTLKGKAIPLSPSDHSGYLNVAEGIETALAVYQATALPTWSTINATLMPSVQIPQNIHTVLIWADLDRSKTGQHAAEALKMRLDKKGIKAIILLPNQPIPIGKKSVDWNDVLMEAGISGFPAIDVGHV